MPPQKQALNIRCQHCSTQFNASHQRISTKFNAEKSIAKTILPNRQF